MLGMKTDRDQRVARKRLRPGRDFGLASKTLGLEINRMMQEQQVQTLLLASAYPGDGRTLIAATLATALVDLGLRVTVVAATQSGTALANQLLAGADPDTLTPAGDGSIAAAAGLTLVPEATLPIHYPDPEEMGLLLQRLRSQADVVLLDSVACLSAPDAYILAPLVDAVIYVVRRRQQDVVAQRSVIARLTRFGARLAGTLYNEKECH